MRIQVEDPDAYPVPDAVVALRAADGTRRTVATGADGGCSTWGWWLTAHVEAAGFVPQDFDLWHAKPALDGYAHTVRLRLTRAPVELSPLPPISTPRGPLAWLLGRLLRWVH